MPEPQVDEATLTEDVPRAASLSAVQESFGRHTLKSEAGIREDTPVPVSRSPAQEPKIPKRVRLFCLVVINGDKAPKPQTLNPKP